MLNIRFIIKMLGMMFILETLFMLAATAVAFLYEGNDFYPLLQSSGIMFGTGVLFMLIGLRANEHTAGRREGMLTVTLTWALFSLLGMLPFYLGCLLYTSTSPRRPWPCGLHSFPSGSFQQTPTMSGVPTRRKRQTARW